MTVLAVDAGGACFVIFETARYKLKYCRKQPLTNIGAKYMARACCSYSMCTEILHTKAIKSKASNHLIFRLSKNANQLLR